MLAALIVGSWAFAGGAQAQSSVTIFGGVDLNIAHSKVGAASVTAMDQGGNMSPSRIGFRGVEDLGGGLSAGFWLETAVLPDSGAIQGGFFNRRSTVSLAGANWGEVRLGRDYTPSFWNISRFAPFGTVGVGGSSNTVEGWPLGLGGARTLVRANNSVGYFLPSNLGGIYGQVMYALPEGVDGTKYVGGRLGYAAGPVDVAIGYGRTPAAGKQSRVSTVGGSYDFKVVKLYGNYFDQRFPGDRQAHTLIGVSVPVGAGELKAMVARANRSGPGVDSDDASHWAVGYVHRLSRRTSLYATYGRIANKGNAAYVTGDTSPRGVAGAPASGIQLGVSHNF